MLHMLKWSTLNLQSSSKWRSSTSLNHLQSAPLHVPLTQLGLHWAGRTMRMPPHMNHWKVTPSKISYFFTGTYLASSKKWGHGGALWEETWCGLCHILEGKVTNDFCVSTRCNENPDFFPRFRVSLCRAQASNLW